MAPSFLAHFTFEEFSVIGPCEFHAGDGAHGLDPIDDSFDGADFTTVSVKLDFMRSHVAHRRSVRDPVVFAQGEFDISDLYSTPPHAAMKQIDAAEEVIRVLERKRPKNPVVDADEARLLLPA